MSLMYLSFRLDFARVSASKLVDSVDMDMHSRDRNSYPSNPTCSSVSLAILPRTINRRATSPASDTITGESR